MAKYSLLASQDGKCYDIVWEVNDSINACTVSHCDVVVRTSDSDVLTRGETFTDVELTAFKHSGVHVRIGGKLYPADNFLFIKIQEESYLTEGIMAVTSSSKFTAKEIACDLKKIYPNMPGSKVEEKKGWTDNLEKSRREGLPFFAADGIEQHVAFMTQEERKEAMDAIRSQQVKVDQDQDKWYERVTNKEKQKWVEKNEIDFFKELAKDSANIVMSGSPNRTQTEYDFINPNHYKSSGEKEVWEMMVDIWGEEGFIKHCEMTAFKYRMTAGKKPGQDIKRDLDKAAWYENKAIEVKSKIETDGNV